RGDFEQFWVDIHRVDFRRMHCKAPGEVSRAGSDVGNYVGGFEVERRDDVVRFLPLIPAGVFQDPGILVRRLRRMLLMCNLSKRNQSKPACEGRIREDKPNPEAL